MVATYSKIWTTISRVGQLGQEDGVLKTARQETKTNVEQIKANYTTLIEGIENEYSKYRELQNLIQVVEKHANPQVAANYPEMSPNPDADQDQEFVNVPESVTSVNLRTLVRLLCHLSDIQGQYLSIQEALEHVDSCEKHLVNAEVGDENRELLKKYITRSNGYQDEKTGEKVGGAIQKEIEIINAQSARNLNCILQEVAVTLSALEHASQDVNGLIGLNSNPTFPQGLLANTASK